MNFNGLDIGDDTSWGEGDNHAGLQDTSLDTSDGDSSDTGDLVHVLKGKTERALVSRAGGGSDVIQSLDHDRALVPLHLLLALQHVTTSPAGDRNDGDLLSVEADLAQILLNVTLLGVLDGVIVHLVHAI